MFELLAESSGQLGSPRAHLRTRRVDALIQQRDLPPHQRPPAWAGEFTSRPGTAAGGEAAGSTSPSRGFAPQPPLPFTAAVRPARGLLLLPAAQAQSPAALRQFGPVARVLLLLRPGPSRHGGGSDAAAAGRPAACSRREGFVVGRGRPQHVQAQADSPCSSVGLAGGPDFGPQTTAQERSPAKPWWYGPLLQGRHQVSRTS
jgi:hypothetical protein